MHEFAGPQIVVFREPDLQNISAKQKEFACNRLFSCLLTYLPTAVVETYNSRISLILHVPKKHFIQLITRAFGGLAEHVLGDGKTK